MITVKEYKNLPNVLCLVAAFALQTTALEAQESTTSLTIYSSADPSSFDPNSFLSGQNARGDSESARQVPGFGIIKEDREFELTSGVNQLSLAEVPQFIDPTTLHAASLTDPEAQVLGQEYQFDLIGSDKLLERYVDKEVSAIVNRGGQTVTITGTLLATGSFDRQMVIQTASGIEILDRSTTQLHLGALPGGLITKPSLLLSFKTKKPGKHTIRSSYQSAGLTWRSDYNLILSNDETTADLSAWVSLLNLSGSSFKNAKLKLVAGDVARITPRMEHFKVGSPRVAAMASEDAVGFEERAFFEYHLYSLPQAVNLNSHQTKQLSLFPAIQGLPVQKQLIYDSMSGRPWYASQVDSEPYLDGDAPGKVSVSVEFKNNEASKLGRPLPAGRVRLFKRDTDGSIELVGEDLIDHTAKDSTVTLKVGNAFDVTGKRTVLDFKTDSKGRKMEELIRINLKNAKEVPVTVLVRESLYRGQNWSILDANQKYKKADAFRIEAPIEVPARSETNFEYRVRYTW